MTLRSLERAAIAGLLAGAGLLILDAVGRNPTNFFRYMPRLRPGRGSWSHLESLSRSRPALVLGALLLCAALVLALIVTVTALVRAVREVDSPAGEDSRAP